MQLELPAHVWPKSEPISECFGDTELGEASIALFIISLSSFLWIHYLTNFNIDARPTRNLLITEP